MEKIFDLGDVAVFKTANKAAKAEVIKAAVVVTRVPIQRPHDNIVGSCLIICGTVIFKRNFY